MPDICPKCAAVVRNLSREADDDDDNDTGPDGEDTGRASNGFDKWDDGEGGVIPRRKCHDCGKPTWDYRCYACRVKWQARHGVPRSFGCHYDGEEA